MCGIVAYVSHRLFDPTLIHEMTNVIRHRGPDDEGSVFFDEDLNVLCTVGGSDTPRDCYGIPLAYAPSTDSLDGVPSGVFLAMGNRRLSIIDVRATGHQPMCTPDRTHWIVYNGEVYNYVELRNELRSLGYEFVSESDTEVILHAYREWGTQCLSRLNGMFAFVIVNCQTRTLFAVRDRFGIKPLYYWVSPLGDVCFASEIKQFTRLPNWRPRMNGQRVYDFLVFGYADHTEETCFDAVFQLRGGEYVELDLESYRVNPGSLAAARRLRTQRWYILGGREYAGTIGDAGERFEELLRESVQLRLRADVPVGSCLSGGLDSSSIVTLMCSLLNSDAGAPRKTFSAYAADERFDEREYVKEVVRTTGFEHHSVTPSIEELFDHVDSITWHQDEPFGSTSIYAQWHVFRLAAANGVKVMLDGQGGDEQLAGYHHFFAPRFAGLFRRLKWITLWREIQATKQLHGYSETRAARQIASMLVPSGLRKMIRATNPWGGRPRHVPGWLNLDVLNARPVDVADVFATRTDSICQMSMKQLLFTVLPRLLHWEDRNSMAHAVESRLPFLDYRLVEVVLGFPDHYKLADGMTKRVLREGMRGILPETVRTRVSKFGFETPEEVWVREWQPDAFLAAVRQSFADSCGVLDERNIGQIETIVNGKGPFDPLLWRIVSFGIWQRKFEVTL